MATGRESADRSMAKSGEDRTEKATPKRRQEALERGQVARSKEINTAMALLVLFGMLAFVGTWALGRFMTLMTVSLRDAGESDGISRAEGWAILMQAGETTAAITAPFAIAGLIGGVIAAGVQVKPGIYMKVLKPRFSGINPKNGVKRLASPRSLVSVVKDIFKLLAIGGLGFAILSNAMPDLFGLMGASPGRVLVVVAALVLQLGLSFTGAYILIAILDFIFERWQTERDMRMTKQEVKREAKDQDLSPEIKGQIKQKQREAAVRRMMAAVPDADVVITNPTHFAVALRYATSLPAPKVVAKGADAVARRIIAVAEEHEVAVVQDPPLARSLFAAAEVGDYIPADAFAAVAEILAHVYRIAGRQPAAA